MVDHGHRLYVADSDEKCARAANGNDDEMNALFGGGDETMIG